MGYIFCSMSGCKNGAHGAHTALGENLCKKCKAAYELGISHAVESAKGVKFPYKLGGNTWEKP